MKPYCILFVLLLSCRLHAQQGYSTNDHSIYGLWEVSTGIEYFFAQSGQGSLFVTEDTNSVASSEFSFQLDTVNGHCRAHLVFQDNSIPDVCFIYDGGGESLSIYSLSDFDQCPVSDTQADIRHTVWLRNLGGK